MKGIECTNKSTAQIMREHEKNGGTKDSSLEEALDSLDPLRKLFNPKQSPTDMLSIVAQFLPFSDLKNFSLVNKAANDGATKAIRKHLSLDSEQQGRIDALNQDRRDRKTALSKEHSLENRGFTLQTIGLIGLLGGAIFLIAGAMTHGVITEIVGGSLLGIGTASIVGAVISKRSLTQTRKDLDKLHLDIRTKALNLAKTLTPIVKNGELIGVIPRQKKAQHLVADTWESL